MLAHTKLVAVIAATAVLGALVAAASPVELHARQAPGFMTMTTTDQFTTLPFMGGVQDITLGIDDQGQNTRGIFVTVANACFFQSSVKIDSKPATGVVVSPCTDNSAAGGQVGSTLYYVPWTAKKITFSVQAGRPVNIEYRAQRGVCNDPRTTRPWSLTGPNETPLPTSAPSLAFVEGQARDTPTGNMVCSAGYLGNPAKPLALADIYYWNNLYAGHLAQACLKAQNMVDTQVIVNSWAGNNYGGAVPLALNLWPSITVTMGDGKFHNAMCQVSGN